MVLVHGLLVILSSRRFSSVEVSWWVGPCTMGESRITSWIEISRQVSRRLGNRHGNSGPLFGANISGQIRFARMQKWGVRANLSCLPQLAEAVPVGAVELRAD